LFDHIKTGNSRSATSGSQQRGENPHHGALTGTVGAKEPKDFTLVHREVDAINGLDFAKVTRQVFSDDWCGIRCVVHCDSLTD